VLLIDLSCHINPPFCSLLSFLKGKKSRYLWSCTVFVGDFVISNLNQLTDFYKASEH
jgi:hypothetical protein